MDRKNITVTRNEMILKLYFSFCCYMLIWYADPEENKFKLKLKYSQYRKEYE